MRVLVLASSKRAGEALAKGLGIEPVAIVTPRSRDAARGLVADQLLEDPKLTDAVLVQLREIVAPCLTAAEPSGLVAATEKAIAAATHLTDVDAGAVEALRALARKIDAWDVIVEWALDDASQREGSRPTVPQNDNVSISAYLKYCDQLGLTPAGRRVLALKKEGESAKSAKLTALRGGKAAG